MFDNAAITQTLEIIHYILATADRWDWAAIDLYGSQCHCALPACKQCGLKQEVKGVKWSYNSEETIQDFQASAVARTFDLSKGRVLLKRMSMDLSVLAFHVHCVWTARIHCLFDSILCGGSVILYFYMNYVPLSVNQITIQCVKPLDIIRLIDSCQ